ncbi:GSCOCG00011410001-RA-CDS [Cotesia congregata]|nr:GSCOCG00011410001-RA-CDS [Cotesia congregata]
MAASLNYTQALLTEIVPSKEQAIILDYVDGVQIHEYAVALGSKIGPENIPHLSRIANNRICIYLSTKEVADNLIENHKTVKVRDTDIYIRPLISRNKRLILSNVPPIIPNDVIIEKLKESKINPVSNISTLHAGLNIPGYQHILSFRRQVFIKSEEANNIPTLWKIDFDDTSYYVYLSLDTMLCFNYKEEGHLAKASPINAKPHSDADKTKMTTASHSSQENTVTHNPTFPSLPSRTPTLIAPNNTIKLPANINNTSSPTK